MELPHTYNPAPVRVSPRDLPFGLPYSGGILVLRRAARQHQGPEGVIRNVVASIIRAIAIMTNAVETNRILNSPPSWCVTPPCLPNCYGELFLPICIETAR